MHKYKHLALTPMEIVSLKEGERVCLFYDYIGYSSERPRFAVCAGETKVFNSVYIVCKEAFYSSGQKVSLFATNIPGFFLNDYSDNTHDLWNFVVREEDYLKERDHFERVKDLRSNIKHYSNEIAKLEKEIEYCKEYARDLHEMGRGRFVIKCQSCITGGVFYVDRVGKSECKNINNACRFHTKKEAQKNLDAHLKTISDNVIKLFKWEIVPV